MLEIAFRLTDVLAAEVLQHRTGDADAAGVTLGDEALARSHWAADQIAHRGALELPPLDRAGV